MRLPGRKRERKTLREEKSKREGGMIEVVVESRRQFILYGLYFLEDEAKLPFAESEGDAHGFWNLMRVGRPRK